MKFILWILFFIIFITTSQSVKAQSSIINLQVTDYGWLNDVPALIPVFDAVLQQAEGELNAIQPIHDPQRLVEGVANSTAASSRGIGSDYSSGLNKYLLGYSLGVAADTEKDVGLEDEISGIGAASGVMFGMKLQEKLNGYVNIGGLTHSHEFPGLLDSDLESEISTFNISTHFRYDLIEDSGDNWFGLGGLKLHFGYEYNKNKLKFLSELDEDVEVDIGGGTIMTGHLEGVPKYKIYTETHSFPVELSSNIRFLNIFTLYGGGGLDSNFGKAKGSGDVSANITSPLICNSGLCAGLDNPQVQGIAKLNAEEDVNNIFVRAFAGLQINIKKVSIYGQIDKVLDTHVLAGATGLRVVFE